MKSPRLCLVASLATLISLSATAHAQTMLTTFQAFPEFVASVKSANPGHYVGTPGAMVESVQAFEEMRQHVLSLYDGVEVGHSFLLYDSMYVDCIPIMQQPSVRLLGLTAIAEPPSPSPIQGAPRPPRLLSPLELGLSDRFGNEIKCVSGTIPMLRLRLEELSHFKTLHQFFHKDRPPGIAPGTMTTASINNHRYQVASADTNNLGAETWINVWYPPVNTSSQEVSISQMWLASYSNSQPVQTAEVGWLYPWFYNGAYRSSLFVYWTADGYNKTGCYNTDCGGFVLTSNTVVLGAPAWPGPSVPGGQQVFFDAEFYRAWDSTANPPQYVWWLVSGCDACHIGYYPTSIYNGGLMSQYSTHMAFGGETYSNTTHSPPMGSGAFASAGAGYAAFQENIIYWDLNFRIQDGNLATGSPRITPCYSFQFFNQSYAYNSFYFGGPGGNNCP